jgi:transcriptional regulator with XRE-family HTH domain
VNATLKELRKQQDKTQLEIAKKARISVRTYQGYERGDYEPKVSVLQRIANALNTTVDELLE